MISRQFVAHFGAAQGENLTQWTGLPDNARAAAAAHAGSILLETSRFDPCNQRSYLFLHPLGVIAAHALDEIPQLFSEIEAALDAGFHVAGFFSYECGYYFEFQRAAGGKLIACAGATAGELPLAWFGVYNRPFVFSHAQGSFEGPEPESIPGLQPTPDTGRIVDRAAFDIAQEEYRACILKIKEYIRAGDTYQVNFTGRVSFQTQTAPSAVYATLSRQQPVAYSAFLNVAGHHILSFSPELFFRVDKGRIVTRPMKGTMPRGLDAMEDEQAALRLQNDEKNRAEHVMIVDLERNDLGRICAVGSVVVEDIFTIERYQTLLQMTSTIAGVLRPGTGYYDIFRSIFPCGSITGAPKHRTMEIIRELEQRPRGVYTGAIGYISPSGDSVFNVAIRTLVMKNGAASMGVGGGIVADSDPLDEYQECLLKAAFLTRERPRFQLIETILWERDFYLLGLHLDRLEASAKFFNFGFDRAAVLSRLRELSNAFQNDRRYRVRLLLQENGDTTLASSDFRRESFTGRIRLSPEHTSSTDVFFRHKTTRRDLYDRELAAARTDGCDEVLFTNERNEVTEGAVSNLFIERSGKLLTPPLACGVLPGVFRRHLLETHVNAEEQVITLDDLKTADAVYLCNSVRGLLRVNMLCECAATPSGESQFCVGGSPATSLSAPE